MEEYPFNSPVILTDAIFTAYGGHVANTTNGQRQAAYLIAEQKACEDIDTLLAKTIVTGTWGFAYQIKTDYARVHRVLQTVFIDFDEDVLLTVNGTGNEYVALRDAEFGLIDILNYPVCSACPSHITTPYQVRVAYEVGLQSGTSYQANILLALSTYADIALNEIIGYGNEAPGDAGVQSFSNQEYSERRKALAETVFGNSARANFIAKLLKPYKLYRYSGLK